MNNTPISARLGESHRVVWCSRFCGILTRMIPIVIAAGCLGLDTRKAQSPAAVPDNTGTQVASNVSMMSDSEIASRLPQLSLDRLEELLGLYARLGNTNLVNAISDELHSPCWGRVVRVAQSKGGTPNLQPMLPGNLLGNLRCFLGAN